MCIRDSPTVQLSFYSDDNVKKVAEAIKEMWEQNLGITVEVTSAAVSYTHLGYLYITQAMKVLQVNSDGTLGIQLKKVREESERMMTIFDCNGTEVALYYGQKPYVIANPENNTIYRSKNIWNKSYLLGTDNLGRDILTRLMYGTRVSLMVAFVAVAVKMCIRDRA